MTIGRRILEIRGKEARKSFALRIGIVENTLRNYEMELSLPNSDVISKICREYSVSMEWLVDGTGYMKGEKQCSEQSVVDLSILKKAIHVVEDGLSDGRQHIDAEKKATLIVTVYNFLMDDTANDLQHIVRILKTIS